MRTKPVLALIFASVTAICCAQNVPFLGSMPLALASEDFVRTSMPSAGVVPDAVTALKIAEAVLTPIYGRDQIQNEKPFTATLKDNVWTVVGSLPKDMVGGVAEIDISKIDGRVLRIVHGR